VSTARPPRPTLPGSVIDVNLTARAVDVDGQPIPIGHHPGPAAAALAHLAQLATQAGHPLRARITNHDAHTSIPMLIDPTGHHRLDLDHPTAAPPAPRRPGPWTADWEGERR